MRDQHIDVGVWRNIILIRRLAEFYPSEYWTWNNGENITIDDVANAVHNGIQEVSVPCGDAHKYPPLESRNKDWYIARIIYFINHPEEIRDIKIENVWANITFVYVCWYKSWSKLLFICLKQSF